MKKILGIAIFCLFCISLVGCTKTYHGTAELTAKAREEFPISHADTTEIQYAGQIGKEENVLVWFISGNEYQFHDYLPMEFTVVGKDAYSFVHTYKPMVDRANGVAVLLWKNGYAFLINNPEIVNVQFTLATGDLLEEHIPEGALPYVFYLPSIPTEYIFLTAEGNEI